MDLLSMFDALEAEDPVDRVPYRRAPFGYLGGKTRILDQLIPLLPVTSVYVEPFGGSASVLLNRPPSKLEVYNDRYGGVVAFYRVLRDPNKLQALIERLDITVHSREEWHWSADTWDHQSDIERAARWYYMMRYSFSGKGKAFGRCTTAGKFAGKLRDTLPEFPALHERMKYVQIENLDWRSCFKDYDGRDTVFYLDPPYLECSGSCYHTDPFTRDDHGDLLDHIFDCQGFCALSGYGNKLYDARAWDSVHEFESFVSATGHNVGRAANERSNRTEVLYIKEAK